MDERNACFFIGTRRISAAEIELVVKRLNRAIDVLVFHGITTFITFGKKGFDTLAASIILIKRETGSDLSLLLVRPCAEYLRPFKQSRSSLVDKMLSDMDKIVCITEKRDKFVSVRASTCIGYIPNKLSLLLQKKMLKNCFFINVAYVV